MRAAVSVDFRFSIAVAGGSAAAAGGGPISVGCSDSRDYYRCWDSLRFVAVAYADGVARIFVRKSAVGVHADDARAGMCSMVDGCGVDLVACTVFSNRIVKSAIAGDCCYVNVCVVVLKVRRSMRFRYYKWTYFVEPLSYFPYLWDLTCNNEKKKTSHDFQLI